MKAEFDKWLLPLCIFISLLLNYPHQYAIF